MFKPVQYALRPAALENRFLESRLSSNKQKLGRLFWLALLIMAFFGVLAMTLMPASSTRTVMSFVRLGGVFVSVFGLYSLRWIGTNRQLDWVGFGWLVWVIGQVSLGRYLRTGMIESMAAWDIFVIFVLYLAVPISLRFRVALALALSVVSVLIWTSRTGESLTEVEYIVGLSVYFAANIFGCVCAVQAERTAREEFELLANEKGLKRNLESAFTRLESMSESRNQIFRILAHDLRGSIGGLETIGKLLSDEDEQSEEDRQELIDLLCESSKSSYDLLENLLQWALSENGGFDSEPEDIELSPVVSNNLDFLAVIARNKNIELTAKIDENVIVSADPKMLDTIVRNLVSNAIKFTRPSGSVSISSREREGGFVEVSVEDSGVGIDEGRLSQLFQLPRGKSSLGTEGERGTNLGLRICSDFVARQGGSIQVTSEVGVGSCFTFTLPVSRQLN